MMGIRLFYKLLIVSSFLATSAFALPIYGEDDRQDPYFENIDPNLVKISKRAAAMIPRSALKVFNSYYGFSHISIQGVDGESAGQCRGEAFDEQQRVAQCSGFLIADEYILTAGHCLRDQSSCADNYWVFNFQMKNESELQTILPSHIYRCQKVIVNYLDSSRKGRDYALIKLDRKVTLAKLPEVKINFSRNLDSQKKMAVLGFPQGMPLKITTNGLITDNKAPLVFSSSLDTFGGNSGSIVLNQETYELEGILVSGSKDTRVSIGRNQNKIKLCDRDRRKKERKGKEISVRLSAMPELSILTNENNLLEDNKIIMMKAKIGEWKEVEKMVKAQDKLLFARDLEDKNSRSLLFYMIESNQLKLFNFWKNLSYSLPVNSMDNDGLIPLQHAIVRKRHDWIKPLVQMGAGLYKVNSYYMNPMELAIIQRDVKSVEELMRLGFKINHKGIISRIKGYDELSLAKRKLKQVKNYISIDPIEVNDYEKIVSLLKSKF